MSRLQRDRRRECARCRRQLPAAAFPPNRRIADGLGSWCRECQVAATREWRRRNRQAINARRRAAWPAVAAEVNRRRRELYAARRRNIARETS